MRNVISAEWTKLLPHKGTWLLVWIYPIVVLALLIIGIIVELSKAHVPATPDHVATAANWIQGTSFIWYVPTVTLGRYFIAAYFALVFAGEYGWNTWKLVVPHAARWKLIGAKYVVTIGLLYLAWAAAALLATAFSFLESTVTGEAIPKGVTLATIASAHGALIVQGIAPLLIAAGYATLMAVLTRSTLAAFLISLVLVTLDDLLGKLVMWLSALGNEWLVIPYRILPGYHLDNLSSWLKEGVGYQVKLASGASVAYSQTMSLMVLGAWIVGLGALVFVLFRRQDLN